MRRKRSYGSLQEQLDWEKYESRGCQPNEFWNKLLDLTSHEYAQSKEHNHLLLPVWLLNGQKIQMENPEHVVYRRHKDIKPKGRFQPRFRLKDKNYPSIDAKMIDNGFQRTIVPHDILDYGFLEHIVKVIRGNYGQHPHIIPSQVAMKGTDILPQAKSYNIYSIGVELPGIDLIDSK